LGYQVVLFSVDAATTYSWQLSFTPESTGGGLDPLEGTDSVAALLAPELAISQTAKFNIDHEGAYLVRLVVDAGLGTESTQFVRMRYLTQFGDLKLISAGERRDQNGVVPVDADAEGWSNDQNRNLQRLALFIRRTATSGRALYVDANRGRDSTSTPDDPDNLVNFPGWDSANLVGTGLQTGAEGFGDFSSVSAAIAYAQGAGGRGEAAPSFVDPYLIYIKPGLYVEDLTLQPHIHLIGQGTVPKLLELQRYDAGGNIDFISNNAVVIRTANSGGSTHTVTTTAPETNTCMLQNVLLENTAVTVEPVLKHEGGLLILDKVAILQRGDSATQGPALSSTAVGLTERPSINAWETTIWSQAIATDDRYAAVFDAPKSTWKFNQSIFVAAGSCVKCNETLHGGLSVGDPQDSLIDLEDCTLSAGGATSYCLRSYATDNNFNKCTFIATDTAKTFSIDSFGAGAGAKGGDTNVLLDYCRVFGDVIFDTLSVALASSIRFSTTNMLGTLQFPTATPTTVDSGAHAKSLGYDQAYVDPNTGTPAVPVPSQLGVNNVQDAIDLLVLLSTAAPTFVRQLITFGDHPFSIPDATSILGVDSSGGAITVNLKSVAGAPDGTQLIINDESGDAGANNITLDRCRIDGLYPAPGIAVNHGGVLLYSAGDSGTNAVASIAMASPGTAYTAGDILTVATGTGTAATILVDTTTGGAGTPIDTASLLSSGNYSVDPSPLAAAATTGGSNDATFNLTMVDVVDFYQVP
jgi:hypothetical protein